MKEEIVYLGFVISTNRLKVNHNNLKYISTNRLKMDPNNLKYILDWPTPRDV